MRLKRHRFNPWVGKIPWSKNTGTSLQYSCLENSMGRGAWEATVYGTEKSQTQRNPSFCENFFQLNIIGAWWPPGNPFLKDSRGQTSSKEYRYPICMKVKVTQSRLTLCDPVDYTVHGILQARILEWVPFPSPGNLPNPGIRPWSLELQADSLPAEPQGKPKNTGVGSLSLLQWIFPTQGSDWGILHCRQILYQLSYRGMKIPSFTEPGKSLWCKLRSLQGLTNM